MSHHDQRSRTPASSAPVRARNTYIPTQRSWAVLDGGLVAVGVLLSLFGLTAIAFVVVEAVFGG